MIDLEKSKLNKLYKAVLTLLIILCVYFGVKALSVLGGSDRAEFEPQNVITVSGHGEVQAVPDIATVNFTISKEAKTVEDAQTQVAEIEEGVLDFLDEVGISKKDIKTTSASFNPKYEYQYGEVLPCNEFGCPPSRGKNVIVGYTSSQSIEIKIRDTEQVGEVMAGLGSLEVTNMYGPNFTIDDEDALKMEARRMAIEEAKEKAEILARDLGVRLKDVVSFDESGNDFYPMFRGAEMMAFDEAVSTASVPEIPAGENTISSDVTITYEIK